METLLRERIEGLLRQHPVLLFMKGNKMFPQCGFSAQVVGILKEVGVRFETFNILQDPEIRQGLKDYSKWPTYPQLYVNGKLVGGCDIITELHEKGELASIVPLG